MKFYLGTHHPGWLSRITFPLFISDRWLRRYRRLPVAASDWALDSGGFTELSTNGSWEHGPSPAEYARHVRRYAGEVGRLQWAAPQDWMCEAGVIAKTGLSVAEHQKRTVANYLELTGIAPDLPFIPVLQGWTLKDYVTCGHMYAAAGIDLTVLPLTGIGSVCRRQDTGSAEMIVSGLREEFPGIRLHGFGIKISGLARYGHMLESCDSMAWSFGARYVPSLPGCGHKTCSNCPEFAARWRESVLGARSYDQQPLFPLSQVML